jgi:hypothetical protein
VSVDDAERAELERLRAERAGLFAVAARAIEEVARLQSVVEDYRVRVTLGGPPPAVDTSWANVDQPPPSSASAEDAPPLRTGRGSDRLATPVEPVAQLRDTVLP